MRDDRLAVDIREAFDQGYEPNAGLEERVVASIPWEAPSRQRTFLRPRLAGAFAGVVAVVLIGVLIAPSVLNRLNIPFPGSSGAGIAPAYSLGAVTSDSAFVVQRDPGTPDEILLQSRDGGTTWSERLRFTGIYDGMQMFGQDGFMWSIDLGGTNCGALDSSCMPQMPTNELDLYRTSDGGATWALVPAARIPAAGVFFLDAQHGWIVSGPPSRGLNGDVLYATTDGAKTWTRIGNLPPEPSGWVYGVGLYHLSFSRDQNGTLRGWWVSDTRLYTSTDGGSTWSMVMIAGPTLPAGADHWNVTVSQPVFSGQEGIVAIAYRNPNGPDNATPNSIEFYVSHNGGAFWIDARTAPAGFAPVGDDLAITMLDPQHIWLTSQSVSGGDSVQAGPAVARSSDGGLHWTVTNHTPRILEMTFSDPRHGFALDVTGDQDVNGILETSDAGVTWQRVTVPIFG